MIVRSEKTAALFETQSTPFSNAERPKNILQEAIENMEENSFDLKKLASYTPRSCTAAGLGSLARISHQAETLLEAAGRAGLQSLRKNSNELSF